MLCVAVWGECHVDGLLHGHAMHLGQIEADGEDLFDRKLGHIVIVRVRV